MPDPTSDFGPPFILGNQIDLSKAVTGTDILTVRGAPQDQPTWWLIAGFNGADRAPGACFGPWFCLK